MDKNAIKKYAVWARRELISRVSQRALQYGVSEKESIDADADSVHGHLLSDSEKRQRKALIARVKKMGYEQTMEEAAYTWFNRFIALRFMEVNGYLPTHIRVFTDDENSFKPQIIAEAIHLDPDTMLGLDMEKVYAYKDKNQTDELFKYLIVTQCNALIAILPGMFTRIDDYTELLFPDNLLREGSAVEQMVTTIPEDDWKDAVQIIGWLYQYYNTEPKDKVFADLKKNIKISKENIPAATQLFTPDWIVRYMVENSLGRLWLEHLKAERESGTLFIPAKGVPAHQNADGSITLEAGGEGGIDNAYKRNWKYYLDEAEQEPEVEAQLKEIRKSYRDVKPEDIRCIDPCMGSGHILAYMFDVLVQIYESCGYTTRDAVSSIVENNLYGLDIDDRAAQLAYFAVMMKARQYDRRFFTRGIQPHVHPIMETNALGGSYKLAMGDFLLSKEHQETLNYLLDAFIDAKEYGSILQLENRDYQGLLEAWKYTASQTAGNFNLTLWFAAVEHEIPKLIEQAIILTQQYDVVVTNPPYMGSSGMSAKLSAYVKKYFPDSKSDLFACFIENGNSMVKRNCFNSMVTMQSWMFLSSFEKMRTSILNTKCITNLMHMENMVMGIAFGTAVTVFRNCNLSGYKGTYNQIKLQDIDDDSPKAFPIAGNRFAQVSADNFSKIPGSPVAYWVGTRLGDVFETAKSISNIADVRIGMGTGNNDRFLREWWEVENTRIYYSAKSIQEADYSRKRFFPYGKGGECRRWYGNQDKVIWYDKQGRKELNATPGHRENGGMERYFQRSLTWSYNTSGAFNARFMPAGFVFDVNGSSIFLSNDYQYYVLAFLTSIVCRYILSITNATITTQAGNIRDLPIIIDNEYVVKNLATECVQIEKDDWDSFETSWDFQRHPLIGSFSTVADAYANWQQECATRFDTLKANEEELNRIFIDIYGLQGEMTPEVEAKDVTVRLADKKRDIRSLISYAVGCMFGRYSLDEPGLILAGYDRVEYATKTYDGDDPELEKFATVNADGSKSYGSSYRWVNQERHKSFPIDVDNVIPICDDEYFDDDIVARFVRFIEVVYGKETLEENLRFIADALGGNGQPRDVIRNYFLNDFYADHLKTYQKRPIYWLFDSGKKGGFKALIYMHRYQPDTIARIRTDYVFEQQARYRTAIADLEQRMTTASTSERVKLTKQLQKLQAQDAEIRVYEEKIHHLADQMIPIDLDDGVKHNYEIFKDVLAPIK